MTTTPTPEDFERATVYARRYLAKHDRGPLKPRCDCGHCHILRQYQAALTRLSAAERRVEAWGPMLLRYRSPEPRAETDMDFDALPDDMKPEVTP